MVRDYIVRFWKRMLTMGKTVEDLNVLLASGSITQGEYDLIIS